jgi:two-component system response regulator MprA
MSEGGDVPEGPDEPEVLRESDAGRILLAEDDGSAREGVAEFLRSEGYEVEVAVDGQDALAACRARAPSLLLTDLDMPRMRGEELIDILRREQPDLEIIVLTGEHPYDVGHRTASLGVRTYVRKPVDLDRLLAQVRALLGPP